MELNDDLLYLIAGFSDDIVTVVSKTMRDGYFSKNGIYMCLGSETADAVDFPEYFYNYKISLNWNEVMSRDIHTHQDMGKYLEKSYKNVDIRLVNHVFKNTEYVSNMRIADLKNFTGILRVSGVFDILTMSNLDILETNKIPGCRLEVDGYEMTEPLTDLLDRVENIDCYLCVIEYLVKFPENCQGIIDDRITSISYNDISLVKIYPRITDIEFMFIKKRR